MTDTNKDYSSDQRYDKELDEIVLKPATWQYDDYQKAKAKLSALLRRVEVELLKDLITQHSEVHIVRKTIVHGSDTVPKGSQLGMVPTVYINAIISELGAEL